MRRSVYDVVRHGTAAGLRTPDDMTTLQRFESIQSERAAYTVTASLNLFRITVFQTWVTNNKTTQYFSMFIGPGALPRGTLEDESNFKWL